MSAVKNSAVKMRLNTVIEPGSVVLGRVIFIIIYSKKVEYGLVKSNQFNLVDKGFVLWYNWWITSFTVGKFRWNDCFNDLTLD